MNFRTVALTASAITFVLGLGYLVAGAVVVGRWDLEPTTAVLLLGRRMGALYLGLSIIFFLARSAPAAPLRTALCTGTAFACLALAALGIYERSVQHAGSGILISAAIETLLALGFISVILRERKAATGSAAPAIAPH